MLLHRLPAEPTPGSPAHQTRASRQDSTAGPWGAGCPREGVHTPGGRPQRGRVGPSRAMLDSPEPHTRFWTSALKLRWIRRIPANWLPSVHLLGFPGGTSGKEPTCQCRSHKGREFSPWVGKIPWRRAWQLGTLHGGRLQGFHEQMYTER